MGVLCSNLLWYYVLLYYSYDQSLQVDNHWRCMGVAQCRLVAVFCDGLLCCLWVGSTTGTTAPPDKGKTTSNYELQLLVVGYMTWLSAWMTATELYGMCMHLLLVAMADIPDNKLSFGQLALYR